ncbi:hypothetical protein [Microbacterium hominis]|uniref:YrhK domain-containing protein n=1 Tax=Microbacterium hominis TaxID=162426 RepID=A0A7D4UCJ7_9MICO|nr:hypothetical protein [Microbacterium hominis]QKJ20843.1 hypothetical protein HQM25_16730 [Microbacterium hominis]
MADPSSPGTPGTPERSLGLRVPSGWTVGDTAGVPPFVSRAVVTRPDGAVLDWSTRAHRKGLARLRVDGHRARRLAGFVAGASTSSWWMGCLFMAGSLCFALGSVPLFFNAVDPGLVAWVFFVGSIFFTSAAFLQFRECASAPESIDPTAPRRRGLRGVVGWRPRSLGWWATAVQLVGTVFFNVSTFAATRDSLDLSQERHLIWAPDVWGSVCFLIASWLAYIEVSPRIWRRPRGDLGWWIALLNLAGSVAFGLAAVGARYLPGTGDVANIALVNLGTFLGAVGFFIGALLLPVESSRGRAP